MRVMFLLGVLAPLWWVAPRPVSGWPDGDTVAEPLRSCTGFLRRGSADQPTGSTAARIWRTKEPYWRTTHRSPGAARDTRQDPHRRDAAGRRDRRRHRRLLRDQ